MKKYVCTVCATIATIATIKMSITRKAPSVVRIPTGQFLLSIVWRLDGSILTLSVIACAMPPLPKGEARAARPSASAALCDVLAPPSGELAKPQGFD